MKSKIQPQVYQTLPIWINKRLAIIGLIIENPKKIFYSNHFFFSKN